MSIVSVRAACKNMQTNYLTQFRASTVRKGLWGLHGLAREFGSKTPPATRKNARHGPHNGSLS